MPKNRHLRCAKSCGNDVCQSLQCSPLKGRVRRRFGELGGPADFVMNPATLPLRKWSSQRQCHSHEGGLLLVGNNAKTQLSAGDAPVFPKAAESCATESPQGQMPLYPRDPSSIVASQYSAVLEFAILIVGRDFRSQGAGPFGFSRARPIRSGHFNGAHIRDGLTSSSSGRPGANLPNFESRETSLQYDPSQPIPGS